MTHDELLHKWIAGTLNPEEQKEFEQRPEYPELARLYAATEGWRPPTFDQEAMLKRVLASKQQPGAKVRSLRLPAWGWVAAAASVMLVLALWLWPKNAQQQHFMAGAGETQTVKLADGSSAVLNAESKLDFTVEEGERRAELAGEAFFEVKKGEPFIVSTDLGEVRVLGTAFNVRAREGSIQVQCFEGRVAVTVEGERVELGPGERTAIAGTSLAKESVEADNVPSWQLGITRLDGVTLAHALAELERQFGVTIQAEGVNLDGVGNYRFPHSDLETALLSLLGTGSFDFRIANDQVIISQKND